MGRWSRSGNAAGRSCVRGAEVSCPLHPAPAGNSTGGRGSVRGPLVVRRQVHAPLGSRTDFNRERLTGEQHPRPGRDRVTVGKAWFSFDHHIAGATVTRRVSLAVMTQAYSQETCSRINEPPTGTTRNGTGPLRTSSFQATAHDAPRALCGLPRQSLKGISILAQGSHRRWIPWVPAPQASQS